MLCSDPEDRLYREHQKRDALVLGVESAPLVALPVGDHLPHGLKMIDHYGELRALAEVDYLPLGICRITTYARGVTVPDQEPSNRVGRHST